MAFSVRTRYFNLPLFVVHWGTGGASESENPGIQESWYSGIRERGNPGTWLSGNLGIRELGNPGIQERGNLRASMKPHTLGQTKTCRVSMGWQRWGRNGCWSVCRCDVRKKSGVFFLLASEPLLPLSGTCFAWEQRERSQLRTASGIGSGSEGRLACAAALF